MGIFHTIILCFLVTGCVLNPQVSEPELRARYHMEVAAAKETSSNFQGAINEYSVVYGNYVDTTYYKTAIWRAALLNLHPNNPEIDTLAAQYWLNIYLKLPLSLEETEMAVLYSGLIEQINQSQDEKETLLTVIRQQIRGKAVCIQALKHSRESEVKARAGLKKMGEYEAEIFILKDQLQKMKEIDVQTHNTRKISN